MLGAGARLLLTKMAASEPLQGALLELGSPGFESSSGHFMHLTLRPLEGHEKEIENNSATKIYGRHTWSVMRLSPFVLAAGRAGREGPVTRQDNKPQTRDERGIPGAHTNMQDGTGNLLPFTKGLIIRGFILSAGKSRQRKKTALGGSPY